MRPRSGAKTVRRVLPTRMTLFLKPLLPDSYPAGVFAIPQRQGWLRVGRGQGNDLRVNHDSVSANHAKIFVSEETGTILSDCGSSNGTFVNGVQVSDRFPISVGDLVRFATAEFQVVADASGNLEEEATARIEDPESAARILVLESELCSRGNSSRTSATNSRSRSARAEESKHPQ